MAVANAYNFPTWALARAVRKENYVVTVAPAFPPSPGQAISAMRFCFEGVEIVRSAGNTLPERSLHLLYVMGICPSFKLRIAYREFCFLVGRKLKGRIRGKGIEFGMGRISPDL